MEVRLASLQDKEDWNSTVLQSAGGSFMQTWQWGQVQERQHGTVWRFVFESGQAIRGLALVLKRPLPFGRCWLYVARGPVVVSAAERIRVLALLQKELAALAREQKAIFVRIDPAWGDAEGLSRNGWVKSEREVQPRHTLILDIGRSENELLGDMRAKTRYNIRLAKRKGVSVRFGTSASDVDAFIALSQEVAQRSSFHYHPEAYYHSIISELAPDGMAEVAIAEYDNSPLAAHIMVYAGAVATYAHGASSSRRREVMAPTRLYWETIMRAKEKGRSSYDFFGVAPEDADATHPWAGVTRSKQGFGGRRVDYIGAYDFVFDAGLYSVFNMVKRAKGLLP